MGRPRIFWKRTTNGDPSHAFCHIITLGQKRVIFNEMSLNVRFYSILGTFCSSNKTNIIKKSWNFYFWMSASDLKNHEITNKCQKMKISRFRHAAYQTIRLELLIIRHMDQADIRLAKYWKLALLKPKNRSKSLFSPFCVLFGSFSTLTQSVFNILQRISTWLSVIPGRSFDLLHQYHCTNIRW